MNVLAFCISDRSIGNRLVLERKKKGPHLASPVTEEFSEKVSSGIGCDPLQPHWSRVVHFSRCVTRALAAQRLSLSLPPGGSNIFFSNIINVLTQEVLVPRLSKKYSTLAILTAEIVSLSLSYLGLVLFASTPLLLIARGFLTFGFGTMSPRISNLISINSGADEQGAALGDEDVPEAAGRWNNRWLKDVMWMIALPCC
jgi:hypothetical protein